jgi:serine protease
MPAFGHQGDAGIQPPPVTAPVPHLPPAGEPSMGNMAYFGGHVQVTPKVYLVLWGWTRPGAFSTSGFKPSDPDGAAARMTSFLKAIGGTAWTGSQTQYYETVGGTNVNITNPVNQFGGVWSDKRTPIHNNLSGLEMAQEAARAVRHFGVTDLHNSQFVVATPQNFNEQGFVQQVGYCAWHDYTQQQYYPGVKEGISFTNMPYVLNMGTSCGQSAVNSGVAGRLDGFTIVLGHEVEETVTDPGAEDVIGGANLGGWYDYSGYENGDKCAWVGTGVIGRSDPTIPGSMNNITGNDGQQYPVQSLWSNNAAGGTGYCAGAGNDLPA